MTTPPAQPKVYHITHVDNLAAIVRAGGLISDGLMIARRAAVQSIGMSEIKRRRVDELEVDCHPGTKVGDYVPFYFCPRSIMLYVIHRADNPDLAYRGGQGPIVHLEADLHTVINWAEQKGVRWAVSLSNAGSYYAEFRANMNGVSEPNWQAIAAADFRNPVVKEGKQAEFLMWERFPFELVERIGVISPAIRTRVDRAIAGAAAHRPAIQVLPNWYF